MKVEIRQNKRKNKINKTYSTQEWYLSSLLVVAVPEDKLTKERV